MTRRSGTRGSLAAVAALLLGVAPPAAPAQGPIATPRGRDELARADALVRAGRVEAAEALYCREVRRRPRDPAARLALGRYLASRGATRPGAILIEEARFFGASPVLAALHLAPLYARLGDYKALALLPGAPLGAGERARAEWLAKNPPAIAGPESLTVALMPPQTNATPSLGTVHVVIGFDTLVAEIDPTVRGLVIDTSRARSANVRVFAADAAEVQAGTPAVKAAVQRARLGALTFTNLAATLQPLGSPTRARVGLDLLARFAPSFRPREGRMVLRRAGKLPRLLPGSHVPLVVEPSSMWVVLEGRREAVDGEVVMSRLQGAQWTLDGKRGEIVLQ